MEDEKYSMEDVATLSRIRTRSKRLATDLTSFAVKFGDISLKAEGMLNKELDELKLDVEEAKQLLHDFCEKLDDLNSNVESEYSLTFEDLLKRS